MQRNKNQFRHESLQDAKTLQSLLQAITDGVAKGKLSFSDETGNIAMSPEGLLNLKLSASKEDGVNRFNLRVSWQDEPKNAFPKKALEVSPSKPSKKKTEK